MAIIRLASRAMKTPRFLCLGAAITALVFAPIFWAATAEAPPEGAKKYYDLLLKRPAPGYLFDRFCNAWVDTATLDDLEKFLTSQAEQKGSTADHLLLAFYQSRQGDSVKALAEFRLALEKDPGSADAWYQKAVAETRALNFDTALADCEKAAGAKPRAELELLIRQLQARLLIRSGRQDQASSTFKTLLALRPDDEELREDIIELILAEGLMDDAAVAARELIERTKDPEKKVLRRLRLGDILQRAGKREEAVVVYAETLASTGADSWLEKEILSQIEQVYRREDDLSGLREQWQRMITAEPKRLALRLAQARLHTSDGNTEAAGKAWQEILALTPGHRQMREIYIEQMAALKKLPEALAQMKELTTQHPDDLELLPRLADLHFQNKDSANCLAILKEFVAKSDQKSEGIWLRTAGLLQRYNLGAEALALLTEGAAALPDSEALAESRAASLHDLGKAAEAADIWKKLAAGQSRERTVQLARAAEARGETQTAFEILLQRLPDFAKDPLFLGELANAAVRAKREEEALPWARQRISLLTDASALEPALDDAVRLIMSLHKEQEVIRSITEGASPQEWALAAALEESLGNPKRAEALLVKVSAANPELGGALQVRLYVTRGELLRAAESMKKAIEQPNGRSTGAVQRIVDLYLRAGRLEEALTWTAEWKRLSPGAVLPWETEAQLLALSGRTADSLKLLRQAVQIFPDNEDLKANLAKRYRDEGRLADSQRLLEQLYEDGKDPGAKLKWVGEMAQTAEMQGRMKELVESFEERRRTNRGSTLPLLALSEIYRTAGSYEERRAAMLEAARLKPDDLELLMEIARIEQSQGELASAAETLRKARPLDQSNRATQKLAEVLFTLGKDQEAAKVMEEIDVTRRMDSAAVESLALSAAGNGEWERGETFVRSLLPRLPDNYRLRYLLGLIQEELGQSEAAVETFLGLLKVEKELPNAQPAKSREWLATLQRHLPEAAVQLSDFMSANTQAYMHRRSSGNYYYQTINGVTTYTRASSSQQATLPGDLAELRTWSLQHLATLAQAMDESRQSVLKKEVANRGVVWAAHLLEASYRNSGGDIPTNIAAILRASPNEDYSLAQLCLNLSYRAPKRYLPLVREALTRFRDRHPQLAALALLALLREDDPADLPLIRQGAELMERIESPISPLSSSLSNVAWMADSASVKPERKEIAAAISKKLEAIYAALPANSQSRSQLQYSILQSCMSRRDWPRLVAILEEELATALAAPIATLQANNSNYYRADAGFVQEPPFPPQQLPQMPSTVANRWGLSNNGNSLYLNVPAEEAERFKTAVRNGKNGTIRILLALNYQDEALLDEILNAAAAEAEPSAAVCTILAGWHLSRNEPDKALEWLRRTQFMPLTRDDRALIDRYLLGLITLSGLNPEPDSPDFIAARDAMVRLRQTRLDNAKRESLAAALTALGLNEEADRLLAANTSTTRSASSPQRATQQAQSLETKLEQLYKQGAKDKAMEAMRRELLISARANLNNSYRDSRALMALIDRLNLKEEILKQMQPAEGSKKDLAEYAWICSTFGDFPAARRWMAAAVEARPRDLRIRSTAVRFFLTGEKPDQGGAWKLLDTLPAESMPEVGSLLMNTTGNTGQYAHCIAVLELLKHVLEKHQSDPSQEWSWVCNMHQANVRGCRDEKVNLPPLYQKAAQQENSLTRAGRQKEMAERRRELHDSICQLMSEVPALRTIAFQRLARLRLAEGKNGPDLIALAKQAILTKPDSSLTQRVYYYGDEGSEIPDITPFDYLTEAAHKQGSRTLLDEMATELVRQERPDEAKRIRLLADLTFCPEGEFTSLARQQMLAQKPEDQVLSDEQVLLVWKVRQLPPLLNPILLEKLNLADKRRVAMPQGAGEYLSTLISRGHLQSAKDLVKGACAALLGPPEKRSELFQLHWNPSGYRGYNSPGERISRVRNLFYQALSKDNLSLLLLELFQDEMGKFSDKIWQDDYYGYNISVERSVINQWPLPQAPERWKEVLKGSVLTADLPVWRPLLNPANQKQSILSQMLESTLQANPTPAERKAWLEVLNGLPVTLGRQILISAVNETKKEALNRRVLELLAERRTELEGLSADRQMEMAVLARELAGDSPQKLSLSAEATALLDWLRPKRIEKDILAQFLKPAEKWEKPLALDAWKVRMSQALKLAEEAGREPFHAVVARARTQRIRGVSGPVKSQQRHENSPLASSLLGYLREVTSEHRKLSAPNFWNPLVYSAEVTLDPSNDLDWDVSGNDVQASVAFGALWRDCRKDHSKTEALSEFTNRLSKVFTADQFRLYSDGFIYHLRAADISASEAQSWVDSPAATANPIALECSRLLALAPEWRGPSEGKVVAAAEHLLVFANDEKVPLKARLSTASSWLSYGRDLLPEKAVRTVAALLQKVWQARGSYDMRDAENTLRSILSLQSEPTRVELLRPLLAAAGKITAVHMSSTLDECLTAAALETEDKAMFQRVTNNRTGNVHHGLLAAMLKHDGLAAAQRWFEQNALRIGTKQNPDYAAWTPALAERAAAFAKSLDAPHKTYLAEILLALVPGEEKDRKKAIRERLMPLARKFGEVPVPDAAWRVRILELLALDDVVLQEAAGAFGPLAEAEPLSVLGKQPGSQTSVKLRVLHLAVVNALKQRKFDLFDRYLHEMAVTRSQSTYYSNQDDDPWVRSIRDTLKWTMHAACLHGHEWSEAERVKLGEIYRSALTPKAFTTESSHSEDAIMCAILFHCMSGQTAALESWWKGIPEDQQKVMRERFWNNSIDVWLGRDDLDQRFGQDRAARLEFVRAYLVNPVGLHGGENCMDKLASMGWATRQEILAMGSDVLAKRNQHDTGQQLAVVAEREGAWDIGAELLGQAAAQAEREQKKPALGSLLRRASFLLLAGKTADCLAETARLRGPIQQPFQDGKIELDALASLSLWIDLQGRALLAAGRKEEALAYLGINPFVQILSARESGNLKEAAVHEAIFRYAEAKLGLKVLMLIPKESQWRYRDAAEAPPKDWAAPEFDDAAWPSGQARLGYGDPVKTTLTFGQDKENKPLAVYFRTTFDLADLKSVTTLHVGVQRDDGCVVYLNGEEILRQNMAEGDVDHMTRARSTIDNDPEMEYFPAVLPTEGLRPGKNVLAVEVHQVSPSSSDVTFDLELRANLPNPNDILRDLDAAEIGPKLGDLWTSLPEVLRKALE